MFLNVQYGRSLGGNRESVNVWVKFDMSLRILKMPPAAPIPRLKVYRCHNQPVALKPYNGKPERVVSAAAMLRQRFSSATILAARR
jgi:hypothetical protein